MNLKRVRLLKPGLEKGNTVLYWMSREQRVQDNWALIFAQKLAIGKNASLIVAFCLVPEFLEATIRQYGFMLKGLKEVENDLNKLNVQFHLLKGSADEVLPQIIEENNVSNLVCDFDPLKIKRVWKKKLAEKISIPFYEVDAHNIVPCLFASNKEEFGAYTLRPKIHRLLPDFLDEFPSLITMKKKSKKKKQTDFNDIYSWLKVNLSIKEVDWILPGEKEAQISLDKFLHTKLNKYNQERNNPLSDGQSNLSPYLHFGQLSAQKIALNVRKYFPQNDNTESFLEELIIRRELADNFCYFNPKYDSFNGFKNWAKQTLNNHRKDEREFVYSLEEFENAKTHEDLWNAAQKQLTITGKLHGYMRMYWAKKILEWTESPEEALRISIYLNDKYELDGRDPNGYTGCAWSIGGVHDRAWGERAVFGKIRYMNYNGCKRKFDVDEYIKKYLSK